MDILQNTMDNPANRTIKFIPMSVFIFISAILIYLSMQPGMDIIILSLTLAIPYFYIVIKYPKIWLWTVALTSFIFLRSTDVEVTIMDVIIGFLYVGTIFIWLIWQIAVKREKVVESIIDWLLLFFFISIIFTLIISSLSNVPFIEWFREYAVFSVVLLYFPIKHYMKDKRDLVILFLIFAFSIIIIAIDQFRSYKEIALSQAVYAYQLSLSVRLNQTIFTAGIFFSLLISLLPLKKTARLLLWGFTAMCIAALMVSFSRSFWILVFFGILLMYCLINNKQRLILTIGLIIIVISGSVVFTSVFQDKVKMMTKIIENRLLSATEGKKDVSVYMRLVEYNEVISRITDYPMFGNGLGKKIHLYDKALHYSTSTNNIHNGYLFAMYRFGIPLALIYFVILALTLFRGFKQGIKLTDPFYRIFSLSSALTILMIIVASFASNQFFGRDGGLVLAVSFAIISIAGKTDSDLNA